jgi:hypothetical protein
MSHSVPAVQPVYYAFDLFGACLFKACVLWGKLSYQSIGVFVRTALDFFSGFAESGLSWFVYQVRPQ